MKDIKDKADSELVDRMRTFHTVLLQDTTDAGAGYRVMWIEGHHPANSFVAYDCDFVPPD